MFQLTSKISVSLESKKSDFYKNYPWVLVCLNIRHKTNNCPGSSTLVFCLSVESGSHNQVLVIISEPGSTDFLLIWCANGFATGNIFRGKFC